MNPEERLRRMDDPERWDLPIEKRLDAFPARRGPSPFMVSVATVAAVAVIGIVVFAGFGSGVRTLLHSDPAAPASIGTPSAAAVPWTYQPAAITPEDNAVDSVVPVCEAANISLKTGGRGIEGTASSMTVGMFVVVSGTSACSLDIGQFAVSVGTVTARYSPGKTYVAPVISPGASIEISAVFDESCTTPGAQVSLAHVTTVTATFGGKPVRSDGSAVAPSNYSCSGEIHYEPTAQANSSFRDADGYAIVEEGRGLTAARGAKFVRMVVRFVGDARFDYPNCPAIIVGSGFGQKRAAVASTLPCNSPHRTVGTWAFDVPIPAGASGTGAVRWSLPGWATLGTTLEIN